MECGSGTEGLSKARVTLLPGMVVYGGGFAFLNPVKVLKKKCVPQSGTYLYRRFTEKRQSIRPYCYRAKKGVPA